MAPPFVRRHVLGGTIPLTKKGKKIMRAMRKQYGDRAERVFYASRNAGRIAGVERGMRAYARSKKR